MGRLKPFDLASLRPGGASHLLNLTEDSEVVRRRGRWATIKTMEIYLQEVLYVTYVERLPQQAKEMIRVAAAGFPDLLQKAQHFVECGIPCSAWYALLKGRLTMDIRSYLGSLRTKHLLMTNNITRINK